MYKNKKIKGVADPLTLGIIVVVIIVAGALLYFMMTNRQIQTPQTDQERQMEQTNVNASPVPTVSDSDEVDVMEQELESIDAGSVDEDIESMEQDASNL